MYRIVAAAAVLLLLAGCTPTEAPAPTPSASVSSTPSATAAPTVPATATPTPTQTAEAVVRLQLNAESLEAFGSSGDRVDSFGYNDNPRSVVTALTAIFGEDPKKSSNAAGNTYTWGDFSVRIAKRVSPAPSAEDKDLYRRIFVYSSAKTVFGVDISTVDGVRVGDSAPDVAASHPGAASSDGASFFFDTTQVGKLPSGAKLTLSVWATTDSPTGTIADIRAPSPNYGD